MKFFIQLSVFYFVLTSNSYAYLDPGTGSYILSMVALFFAAIVPTFISFRMKLKSFFSKFKKKTNKKN